MKTVKEITQETVDAFIETMSLTISLIRGV